MKTSTIIAAVALCSFALAACSKKEESTGGKLENKVKDALDTRPNEKLKDAVEDASAAMKDAAHKSGDAAKDAAKVVEEAAKKVSEDLKDAAKEAEQK
jgi:hypothetical protein